MDLIDFEMGRIGEMAGDFEVRILQPAIAEHLHRWCIAGKLNLLVVGSFEVGCLAGLLPQVAAHGFARSVGSEGGRNRENSDESPDQEEPHSFHFIADTLRAPDSAYDVSGHSSGI